MPDRIHQDSISLYVTMLPAIITPVAQLSIITPVAQLSHFVIEQTVTEHKRVGHIAKHFKLNCPTH